MNRRFTLEYWLDDGTYVGRLREVPGVFSQGGTLVELEDNIRDAFALVLAETGAEPHAGAKTKEIALEVA